MTMLSPCPACDRHVKLDAGSSCPFCAAYLGAPGKQPSAGQAPGGARRAALLAVSAALASTAFIACGDDSPTGGSSSGGSSAGGQAQGGDNAGGQVAIGGAGGQETSGGGGAGGDGTGGNIAPPYGAPPV